jgi:hypothetical protein
MALKLWLSAVAFVALTTHLVCKIAKYANNIYQLTTTMYNNIIIMLPRLTDVHVHLIDINCHPHSLSYVKYYPYIKSLTNAFFGRVAKLRHQHGCRCNKKKPKTRHFEVSFVQLQRKFTSIGIKT